MENEPIKDEKFSKIEHKVVLGITIVLSFVCVWYFLATLVSLDRAVNITENSLEVLPVVEEVKDNDSLKIFDVEEKTTKGGIVMPAEVPVKATEEEALGKIEIKANLEKKLVEEIGKLETLTFGEKQILIDILNKELEDSGEIKWRNNKKALIMDCWMR